MEGHRAGGQEGQRGLDVQDFHPARDSGHRSARQAVWRDLGEVRRAARNLQSRKIAARRIELQGRRSCELISTYSHRSAPQGTETRITSSLLLVPVPLVSSFLRL